MQQDNTTEMVGTTIRFYIRPHENQSIISSNFLVGYKKMAWKRDPIFNRSYNCKEEHK